MIQLQATDRARIAAAVGMHEQYLYQCLTRRRPLPPDRAPAIERATEGRVTVEQMRPDVRWARIPDPAWPHPQGRPTIDVCPPPAEPTNSQDAA